MSELPVDRSGNNPTSHAIIRLDAFCGNSAKNAQAIMAYLLFNIQNVLIKAFEKISQARNKSGLAAIQSGFNSADQTKTAGSMLAAGGLTLGAAGVVQGVGNFQQAKGVAEAAEARAKALAELDDEAKAVPNDLEQDLTIQVEALDEPCSAPSNLEDDLVVEIEEEALSSKQAKPKEKVEEIKDLENNKQTAEEKKDKKIKLINKEYEIIVDKNKTSASKFQAAGAPGQAAYYVAQGLSEHQKSKSQKEGLIQQVQQDNQNQQGNTADGIKREVDKLTDFDPFQRNSSSQR